MASRPPRAPPPASSHLWVGLAVGALLVGGGLLLWSRRHTEADEGDEHEPRGFDSSSEGESVPEAPALPPETEPPVTLPGPPMPGPPVLPSAPPGAAPEAFRTFRLTSYWVAPLQTDPNGIQIYDQDGKPLALLTEASKADLDLEGTGRLPDGRVINYSNPAQRRYRVLPAGKLGLGAGRFLTPFRSIAVDLGDQGGKKPWKDSLTRGGPLIPVGTQVFVRELVGIRLPDGGQHDGWCIAEDTGNAIYGAHLDFFVGDKKDRFRHPEQVHIWFEGIEAIPPHYTYGLIRAKEYKHLRPPHPQPRVS